MTKLQYSHHSKDYNIRLGVLRRNQCASKLPPDRFFEFGEKYDEVVNSLNKIG